MTPFGARMRELRAERGYSMKAMAADLQISAAYLSALEHGRRGQPSRVLLHQICGYFGLIWEAADEIERLAALSDPKVVVDTQGMSPAHTLVANLLARRIRDLPQERLDALIRLLDIPTNG